MGEKMRPVGCWRLERRKARSSVKDHAQVSSDTLFLCLAVPQTQKSGTWAGTVIQSLFRDLQEALKGPGFVLKGDERKQSD
jgi:hypothetical protein